MRTFGHDANNGFRVAALASGKVLKKAVMVWDTGVVDVDGGQAYVLSCATLCGHVIACTTAGLVGCTWLR